jgi:hypothetical protein
LPTIASSAAPTIKSTMTSTLAPTSGSFFVITDLVAKPSNDWIFNQSYGNTIV